MGGWVDGWMDKNLPLRTQFLKKDQVSLLHVKTYTTVALERRPNKEMGGTDRLLFLCRKAKVGWRP